eukprot:MONOS_16291.1-p1 / transcript=MONOS_16291.1 / gene=MONOS_16291 / organism=Monocercomonoides_exilis_PA203 / gene_product=unspecified product / transcript_product=unspecified product / location=Mono_scaffold01620:3383-4963(+) / protein_length=340 / sequence_SO=supercontig / SO=protein_coding / is_pseudo=false
MNDLPNELINMIMENCDYHTLLSLQKVNKKMKMLVQNEVLWMNQCSSELQHFREILGLNSTKIQPLSLNDCGFRPSKESLVKYGLSKKGWKRTFLAYLKTVNSIQIRKSQLERKAKQKYNQSMILWGVLFVVLFLVVGLVIAGGIMIPFAAEALEKGNRPNCLVSFTFCGIAFSIGIVAASFYLAFLSSEWEFLIFLFLTCFLIPPALWLDGVMKISFSVPLIPYEIVYLFLIVSINIILNKYPLCKKLGTFLAILSSLASFLLVVLKADGIASYCWTITLIPTYLAYWLVSSYIYDDISFQTSKTYQPIIFTCLIFVFLLLLLLLPALRMDGFVKGHFC